MAEKFKSVDTLFETWWYTPSEFTGKSLDDCYSNSAVLAAFCFTAGRLAQYEMIFPVNSINGENIKGVINE